jgi:hypothetical protein
VDRFSAGLTFVVQPVFLVVTQKRSVSAALSPTGDGMVSVTPEAGFFGVFSAVSAEGREVGQTTGKQGFFGVSRESFDARFFSL